MADEYGAYVVALLHCNGDDAGTVFTDSSLINRTFTGHGNAQTDTGEKKFGSASLQLDGDGDYLTAPQSSDFAFGTGDFTIEAWVYLLTTEDYGAVVSCEPDGASAWTMLVAGQPAFIWQGQDESILSDTEISTGAWYHYAVARAGSTLRMFIDGALVAFTTTSYDFTCPTDLNIGRSPFFGNYFYGWIDDLRITKGIARYTANFTPPVAQLQDPAMTVAPSLGALTIGGLQPMIARPDVPPGLLTISGLAPTAVVPLACWMSAPAGVGDPSLFMYLDFSNLVANTTDRYVLDLVVSGVEVRVPMSSWQASLQVDRSSFVQAVIPAATAWVSTIEAATTFIVRRRALDADGNLVVECEMARGPVQTIAFDRGPYRETCTLSGYMDAFAADENPPAALDRTLSGVRSTSSTGTSSRVRCSIDWLLTPGRRAWNGVDEIVVDYVNYYVSLSDAYMDVGSR